MFNVTASSDDPIYLVLSALDRNEYTPKAGGAASQSNGQALPSWLTFNAKTETFSRTAPSTVPTLTIKVTATDTSALAASETFTASATAPVVKPGITVSAPAAPRTWTDGQSIDLVLPGKTFTDALGLKMTFAAYEEAGPNATSWLHFNPTMDELFGKVPANASGTAWLAVVAASAAQHMSAMDLFPVTLVAGSTQFTPGGVTPMGMAPIAALSHLTNMLLLHFMKTTRRVASLLENRHCPGPAR
ncbi:MAG TPA: putative Ig domain-containing protein [Acetobacteraceae bacterium]|nr:putative Ig domain-containing protein [Acetobacteraceae bacterium]